MKPYLPPQSGLLRGFSHSHCTKSMNAFGRRSVTLGAQKTRTKTEPGTSPGSAKIRLRLTVEGWGHIVLGHNLLGVVGQCFGLRQKLETLDDFWV
jgi:hypothetical protein